MKFINCLFGVFLVFVFLGFLFRFLLLLFLFFSQQVELFWAKNWGRKREERKKSKEGKPTTPGYLETADTHFPAPVTLYQHWKFHSIVLSDPAVCQERAKLLSHQVRAWLWCEPKHSHAGEWHMPASASVSPPQATTFTHLTPEPWKG